LSFETIRTITDGLLTHDCTVLYWYACDGDEVMTVALKKCDAMAGLLEPGRNKNWKGQIS